MTRKILAGLAIAPFSPLLLLLGGEPSSWTSVLEDRGGLMLWLLTISFSLVLFFTRAWMTRREKTEEKFDTAISGMAETISKCEIRLVGVEERQAAALGKISEAVDHLDKVLTVHLHEEPEHWENLQLGQTSILERLARLEGEQSRVRTERAKERRRKR